MKFFSINFTKKKNQEGSMGLPPQNMENAYQQKGITLQQI